MAITFGTNQAGTSRGAYAIFSVSDSVGAASISILDGDVATGAVTAVTNAVPLSVLQLSALSTILKNLVSVGTVGGNELEYLRKLVGVLPLNAGDTVTLSAANVAGNVWRLSASLSVAGTAIVYVPNSAAAGPFTGDGASSGSSAPPSGAAGGVLGYTGSTYPNPNGLASIANVIPVKAPAGAAVTVKVDDVVAGAGKGLTLSAGATSVPNTAAGTTSIQGPAGSNAAGAAKGGNGGFITVISGDGGQGAPGLQSGNGGALVIQAGSAGALNGGLPASQNGTVAIAGGSSANAAVGGSVGIQAGTGLTTRGNISIGIGASTRTISIGAQIVELGVDLDVSAGNVIVGTAGEMAPGYFLTNTTGGPVDLNPATPIRNADALIAGNRIYLVGSSGTDDIVIKAGGNVKLAGGVDKTLGSGGYFEAIWDGANWIQAGYNQSAS